MVVPTIHVHTQVDKATVQYARFMWEAMQSMAERPDELNLTVHCLGPRAAAIIDAYALRNCRTKVTPNPGTDPLNGSKGHGACVNEALAMTGDGAIHVIADSDTVVVARGWDEYLRQRLVNDRIGIVGSTYEDPGGFSSGDSRTQTYKKVPSLTWCALSPHHDWRSLDVTPNKDHIITITSELLSQVYNLPVGYSIFGEVGWQIPQYVHDHRLRYEGWRQLKPTRDALVLKGLSDYHEEFHVGDVPFVTHHRGSMRHAYRSDKLSQQFYGAIDAYLAKEVDAPVRFKWVNSDVPDVPVFTRANPEAPEPPVVYVEPETYVPTGTEWLKVSFNGRVVRNRGGIDRSAEVRQLEFERPGPDKVGHVRIEGTLEHDFPLILPPTPAIPYMVTVRNAAGAPLKVSSGGPNSILLPSGCTWFVLVDVDGVQYVG